MKFKFKGDQIGEVVTNRPGSQEPDGVNRVVVLVGGVELIMKKADFDMITVEYIGAEDKTLDAAIADAGVDYSGLTKAGLIDIAKDMGIELDSTLKKAEIIAAIQEAKQKIDVLVGGE